MEHTPDQQSRARQDSSLPSPLLQASQLCCVRDDRVLFEHFDLQMHGGCVVELRGDNGSGKTSLLRLLSGLAQPNEGEIQWRGRSINEHRTEYSADMLYLAHTNAIKSGLTAAENLAFYQALNGSTATHTVGQVLARLGLEEMRDNLALNLSAGQRRRLALGRLLLSAASLWLLDEPFTSLDSGNRSLVAGLIIQHVSEGGAALIATHERVDWHQCPVEQVQLS